MSKCKSTNTKPRRKRNAAHSDTTSEQPGESMVTFDAGFPANTTCPAHDQIALCAYLTWIAKGRLEGCADEHWYRAEHELRSKDTTQP